MRIGRLVFWTSRIYNVDNVTLGRQWTLGWYNSPAAPPNKRLRWELSFEIKAKA